MSAIFMALLVCGSAGTSCLGIAWYLRYARRRELLDVPNDRSSHSAPTPRGGGVVFSVVFSTASLCSALRTCFVAQEMIAALVGLTVAGIGYWDDRASLKASTRLAVQLASAGVAVAALTTLHQAGRSVGVGTGDCGVDRD